MAKPTQVLIAIESFFWGQRFVEEGEAVSSDDPVVQKREHLFSEFVIESATAAPGEKRNVTIQKVTPSKKAKK